MTGRTPAPRRPRAPHPARLPALMVAVAGLLVWALLSAGAKPPAANAATPSSPAAAAAARDAPRPKKCPRHFPDCAIGPASEAVALAMLATTGSPAGRVYLYAEAGDGWQRGRIYDVHGDHLEPRPMTPAIASTVEHLWQIPAAERRWTSVEIVVADGRFSIDLAYDEPPPPARQNVNRRADAKAKLRYPDKPVRRASKWTAEPAGEDEAPPSKS